MNDSPRSVQVEVSSNLGRARDVGPAAECASGEQPGPVLCSKGFPRSEYRTNCFVTRLDCEACMSA